MAHILGLYTQTTWLPSEWVVPSLKSGFLHSSAYFISPANLMEGEQGAGGEGGQRVSAVDAVRKVIVRRKCTPQEVELLRLQHRREQEEQAESANKKKGNKKKAPGNGKQEESLLRLREELDGFVADTTRTQHDFSPSLSSSERAILHEWAEELGLEHSSSGFGRNRHIMVKKRFAPETHITADGEIEEILYHNGYVGLSGPLVNAAGRHMAAGPASPEGVSTAFVVPIEYLNNRVRRDGNESHITLLTKAEVDSILPKFSGSIDAILSKLAETVSNDWQDVGLGKLEDGSTNEVYFRVVIWESGQKAREAMGLGKKDFHITVGFKKGDIHHRAKDHTTLVS